MGDQRADAIEVVRATIAGCCRSDIGEVTLATAIVDALFERFPPQPPYWWDGSKTRTPTAADLQQFDGKPDGS